MSNYTLSTIAHHLDIAHPNPPPPPSPRLRPLDINSTQQAAAIRLRRERIPRLRRGRKKKKKRKKNNLASAKWMDKGMKHKDFSEGSRLRTRGFQQPLPKKDGSLRVKAAVCFAPYVWIFSRGPMAPRRFDSISSAWRGVIYAQSLSSGEGRWFRGCWGEVGRSVSGEPLLLRNGRSRHSW